MPLQNSLQECAVIIKQHHKAAELSCLSEQDGLFKEKGTEMTSVNITNAAARGQEDTDPSSDSQLETCGVNNEENEEEAERKQIYSKRNLDLEKNQDKPSTCTSDAEESTAGLPAKKKRRMGLCGLTKKEWNHSLQKNENWPNVTESSEKQIYDKTPKSVALEEEPPSDSASPQHVSADCITERNEPEPTPQNSHHQSVLSETSYIFKVSASVLQFPKK